MEEIDHINIFQARLLAMHRAVLALTFLPSLVLINGKHCPKLSCPSQAIIKGDQKIAEISAASIMAKVHRDAEMCKLDVQYPGYGFAKHKGYGTAYHLQSLKNLVQALYIDVHLHRLFRLVDEDYKLYKAQVIFYIMRFILRGGSFFCK